MSTVHKQVTIIVNTQKHRVEKDEISFEELVAIAYPTPPEGNEVKFTVTYHKGPQGHEEGKLLANQKVKVKDGMVFDVSTTYKS